MSDMVKRLRSHIVGADPASRCDAALRDAADEIERQRQLIEDIDASGIHSCHDHCQRLECAQRREIERLRAEVTESRRCETESYQVSEWLQREHDKLRAEIAQHAMVIASWKREELDWHEDNRALLAENNKLRADALRYRWLRDRSTPPDAVYIATDRITQSMVGDSIDAAIDAAMSIDAAMAQEPPR